MADHCRSFMEGFARLGVARPAFHDIANAIAAFMAFEFRADDSPFDRYLRDGAPLPLCRPARLGGR